MSASTEHHDTGAGGAEPSSPLIPSATQHFPSFFAPQDDGMSPEDAQKCVRDFLRNPDLSAGLGLNIAEDAPFKAIDGGITNGLLKVDDRAGKGYLVRIFGKNTELLINREQDNRLFEFLALPTVSVAPKLYCVFGNGRVEEMLDAKALEPHHMHARGPPASIDLLSAIADTVSKFHLLAPPGVSEQCVLWARLYGFFRQAQEAYPCPEKGKTKFTIHWSVIEKELEWLKTVLPSEKNQDGKALMATAEGDQVAVAAAAAMFRSAFCHNDLLSGNFLLDNSSPFWSAEDSAGHREAAASAPPARVHLIDYEYADTNYVGFDLANNICEHAGFSCNFAHIGEGGDFPTRDIRRAVVSAYATRACERAAARLCSGVGGAPKVPVEDKGEDLGACKTVVATVSTTGAFSARSASEACCRCQDAAMTDAMTNWVEKFCLASHFWWGLWAFVQSRNSAIDFDFEGYAIKRLKGYALHKAAFFGITEPLVMWEEAGSS